MSGGITTWTSNSVPIKFDINGGQAGFGTIWGGLAIGVICLAHSAYVRRKTWPVTRIWSDVASVSLICQCIAFLVTQYVSMTPGTMAFVNNVVGNVWCGLPGQLSDNCTFMPLALALCRALCSVPCRECGPHFLFGMSGVLARRAFGPRFLTLIVNASLQLSIAS